MLSLYSYIILPVYAKNMQNL